MIQYANTAIDTVQGVKTSFVNTFITQEDYKKPLLSFVDAQTSFAKAMVKSAYDVVTKLGEDMVKFDAVKAFSAK